MDKKAYLDAPMVDVAATVKGDLADALFEADFCNFDAHLSCSLLQQIQQHKSECTGVLLMVKKC